MSLIYLTLLSLVLLLGCPTGIIANVNGTEKSPTSGNASTFLIYVLCYDHYSCLTGHEKFSHFSWSRLIMLPQSVFFESVVFIDIIPQRINEWINYDYVGTVSWKAFHKFEKVLKVGELSIPDAVSSAPAGVDVIGLLGWSKNLTNGKPISMLTKANNMHHRFSDIWSKLLGAMNYTSQQISTEGMIPFHCNYFLTKPAHMLKFISFIRTATNLMQSLTSIQEDLWSDVHYKNNIDIAKRVFGRDSYAYHPFIGERLSPFFFNAQNLSIYIYKTVMVHNKATL